jgi:hypothetical protein
MENLKVNLHVGGLQPRKSDPNHLAGKGRTSRRITSNHPMAAGVYLPSAGADPTPSSGHSPGTFEQVSTSWTNMSEASTILQTAAKA